jgi:EAL domain-containing protein (putative c-di-GMP-specific phosphodiesterase class I)
MYFAKNTGRNNVQFFRQEISSQIQERLSVENGLRQALSAGELAVHYQPVCQVNDNRIVGAEALVRWQHPEKGWVPPARFIPIAEETNLIIPLGQWVLEETCRTIRQWDSWGLPPLTVAVNVSAKQIFHEEFPSFVARTLQYFGVAPQRLELEVTENLFLDNLTSVETVIRELKAIGVGLALDDFGTGYSCLSYLKRFRIDKLKIDRSFIADVCHDEQDAILTDSIILLAQSLGLKAVAEGVETQEQLSFLRRCRCAYFQGFLCSGALPAEGFAALISQPIVMDFPSALPLSF